VCSSDLVDCPLRGTQAGASASCGILEPRHPSATQHGSDRLRGRPGPSFPPIRCLMYFRTGSVGLNRDSDFSLGLGAVGSPSGGDAPENRQGLVASLAGGYRGGFSPFAPAEGPSGLPYPDDRIWTTEPRPWTPDHGPQTTEPRPWNLDHGIWTTRVSQPVPQREAQDSAQTQQSGG